MASINRFSPFLAIAVGVAHAGLSPILAIGGVKPNLVLIAAVLVTVLVGFLSGAAQAFIAGVTANVLGGEPLGSVPLTLLAVVALTAAAAPLFARLPLVYPLIAVFGASIVADAATLLLRQLLGGAPGTDVPLGIILAAAALNAGIAGLVLVVVRLVVHRRERTRSGGVSRWPT